jgi:transcriptional regulator with XRE-family HTH domain
MARQRTKPTSQHTGLYFAREARGMSRTELVRRSGVSKQQLSRLENGLIRLRLDHLKPFAPHLGYTPEQMLLWGRYPGTEGVDAAEGDTLHAGAAPKKNIGVVRVPELDMHANEGVRERRKDGRYSDPVKTERWAFPERFVGDELRASPDRLVIVEAAGDSMAPTVVSGERVIVDTGHKTPTPDGLYAVRDAFKKIVVRRLQVLRAAHPTRVKIVFDNAKHPSEEVALDDLEMFGKVLCCLKLC